MSKLSLKHQQFVNEYLKCWNATEAYKAAYPKASSDTARNNGSALLANASITAEIQQRLNESAMTANEVVQRLGKHGRADMSDFLEVDESGYSLCLDKAKKLGKLDLLKKITRTEKTFKAKGGEETVVTTTVELHDVQNALTLIGKKHGLFSDQFKITNELDRALELLEKNLDDDTFDRILSILATGGFGSTAAAKANQ